MRELKLGQLCVEVESEALEGGGTRLDKKPATFSSNGCLRAKWAETHLRLSAGGDAALSRRPLTIHLYAYSGSQLVPFGSARLQASLNPVATSLTPALTSLTPALTSLTLVLTSLTPALTSLTPALTSLTAVLTSLTPVSSHLSYTPMFPIHDHHFLSQRRPTPPFSPCATPHVSSLCITRCTEMMRRETARRHGCSTSRGAAFGLAR